MKKLYIVYVHITPDGMYYYGVTNNIKNRWKGNGIGYKETSLQPYIEKYGWENIQHKVLFENLPKEDALKIEDSLIVSGWEKGNCINKYRSGNIKKEDWYIKKLKKNHYNKYKDKIQKQHKEYQEQHKEEIKEYQKMWYEQNKDKIKEQSKQYYEENKDKIKEQSKQYQKKNRDKINKYKQEHYQKNKDKYREYKRQYRQRKKEEKQLKELGYIPLF